MKKLVSSALTVAALLVVGTANAQQVVLVGISGPLTGAQASEGKDNENGARMAVDELNNAGITVAGSRVTFKLVSEDDQADPRIGVQVAQKLVDAKVAAVLGPYNSGVAIPASRLYHNAGIPMLSVASNPALTLQGFDEVFRIGASDGQLGAAMANFAVDTLKAKTAAVIDDRSSYGQGVAEEFMTVAKARGLSIVDKQYTNGQAVDFKGVLSQIKATNPDVIFYGGYASQSGPLVKQMRQLGLRAKLLGGDGICTSDMAKIAGPAGANAYCSQGGVSLDKTPAGSAFLKKYKSTFNVDTQVYGVSYYDGMKLLADAMVKAGTTTDRAKIVAQLSKSTYTGVAGDYSFDVHHDLKSSGTTVYTFKDAAVVTYGN
ncbi:branched-chain amino acid transport system substrate-binding protein [Paraburkholderia sp. EB58]|jgi:branched-chain amino acid transport system substrate-binding protein|uniref:branched-chain amino acid ABC transporter substrate-binding protein n=1 Tax=Paraburkholderia sp. EB58 TaxID=3035125 RepID=UPI003D248B34